MSGFSQAVLAILHAGERRVVEVPENGEVVFGRASTADVTVAETKVSREHAVVRRNGDALTLRDLGSRNGTRLGNRTLKSEETRIVGGDVFRVGSAEIVVVAFSTLENQRGSDSGDSIIDGVAVADPAMKRVFEVAKRLAKSATTVLLLGETGVGKEVVAQYIHRCSPRANNTFVRLNCAAIPITLLESELFGHEKGSFTGAVQRKIGYFESAHEGTLFLDEIGEVPLDLQVKLLNVLENRCVRRIGGAEDVPTNCRIVCATHRNLLQRVDEGGFRQDLYYRVSTFTVRIPPLRERATEILLLADRFAVEFAESMGHRSLRLSSPAAAMLQAYAWPGNVRELRNAIEHAAVLADAGVLEPRHFPDSVRGVPEACTEQKKAAYHVTASVDNGALLDRMDAAERTQIVEALEAERWNQSRAAERLGISRRTLVSRLKKYGLRRVDHSS